ncbi:MAG: FxsA family protein [Devosia sp.]|nr:FxsA family protein [Devosia sp.]
MVRYLPFALLLLPILEIALFIKVGQAIGLLSTLGLVIGAALLGVLLLRQQGVSVLGQLRREVGRGEMPARAIADAMMLGIAAVLLVLPGFFSDAVALCLLLPPVRGWIYQSLAKRMTVVSTASYRSSAGFGERRIDRPATIDLDDDEFREK